jgi:hypothetical protein
MSARREIRKKRAAEYGSAGKKTKGVVARIENFLTLDSISGS